MHRGTNFQKIPAATLISSDWVCRSLGANRAFFFFFGLKSKLFTGKHLKLISNLVEGRMQVFLVLLLVYEALLRWLRIWGWDREVAGSVPCPMNKY